MRINDTVIVTPIDNPGQFDPDWRNSIAIGLMESEERVDPAYLQYANDPWVRKQMAFFRALKRDMPLSREQLDLRLANIWFQGTSLADVRFRLEPLLLTAVSFDIISLDIAGNTDFVGVIKAYERLYFNIRDNAGRLSPSCQLRQYFALPSGDYTRDTPKEQTWKMIGALYGYDTLTGMAWEWRNAHGLVNDSQEYRNDEMRRVIQSKLFVQIFSERVGHTSMANILDSVITQQKLIQEGKGSGSTDTEMAKAMQGMLSLMSPRLVSSVGADVDRLQLEEASAARLRAESAVDAVDIGEVGKNGVQLIAGG